MNINKLKQLRAYIAEQPEERVDMDKFLSDQRERVVSPVLLDRVRKGGICGTVGCIAGHAAVIASKNCVVREEMNGLIDFLGTAIRWLETSILETADLFEEAKSWEKKCLKRTNRSP